MQAFKDWTKMLLTILFLQILFALTFREAYGGQSINTRLCSDVDDNSK